MTKERTIPTLGGRFTDKRRVVRLVELFDEGKSRGEISKILSKEFECEINSSGHVAGALGRLKKRWLKEGSVVEAKDPAPRDPRPRVLQTPLVCATTQGPGNHHSPRRSKQLRDARNGVVSLVETEPVAAQEASEQPVASVEARCPGRPKKVVEVVKEEPPPAPRRDRRRKLITLATLESGMCRYPYGEVGQSDYHYCGLDTVPKPNSMKREDYCEFHLRKMHQPSPLHARRRATGIVSASISLRV